MSKQIKKPVIENKEVTNRKVAIFAMIAMFIFVGVLIGVLPSLIDDENPIKACVVGGAYLLFTLGCVLHCVTAFLWYKKNQSINGLFQGTLSLISFGMCLLNLKFMLVMIFSAFDKDSLAEKLMGNQTATQYVARQSANWTCLVFALVIMLVLGVLGIVRLSKK